MPAHDYQKLPYRSYKNHLTELYGESLYRVPVDLQFGCPNRLHDGSGGCTFCPEDGARAIQTAGIESTEEQMTQGISFARRRYSATAFMLYIQAYSGTFASVIEQRKHYSELLSKHQFKAISIGTRPDCLNPATLDYLEELNQELDVYIELGVQTIHDKTLRHINRGHDWQSSHDAILELKKRQLKVCAHTIIGLPGEMADDILATHKKLASLPLDGIKIHNLHIVKGTQMATEYMASPFELLQEFQYAELLIECLRYLPASLPVMRFTSDTPRDQLVAPHWQMDKATFHKHVVHMMKYREVCQGDLFCSKPAEPNLIEDYPLHKGLDGSSTFYQKDFKDHLHGKAGRKTSIDNYFMEPLLRTRLLEKTSLKILDIGFGTGSVSLALLEKYSTGRYCEITAVDFDRAVIRQEAERTQNPILNELYNRGHFKSDHFCIKAHWSDARYSVTRLPKNHFDIILIDAFASRSNAELLTYDFLKLVKKNLHANGMILLSNAEKPIVAALQKNGFNIALTGHHQHGFGMAASLELDLSHFFEPLQKDFSSVLSYRDPGLTDTSRAIRRRFEMKKRAN